MTSFRFLQILSINLVIQISLLPYIKCLIITSVIAGDKKFKTVSFDTKLLKPLMFEKELPNTEFRRHRTMRPPKFDIDVNIPIKLPIEDEYSYEEYKKPVVSDIFFETGEIQEKGTGNKYYSKKKQEVKYNPQKVTYHDDIYAAASENNPLSNLFGLQSGSTRTKYRFPTNDLSSENSRLNKQASMITQQKQIELIKSRSDEKVSPGDSQNEMIVQESSRPNYMSHYVPVNNKYAKQEFVPGGFVNFQISGPSGGPKPTYEDYDREKWAQQLSQTAGAMPIPILNYQQLQNFYGGLGTFTNGLAENRYQPMGLLEKFKAALEHFTNKLHHIPFLH